MEDDDDNGLERPCPVCNAPTSRHLTCHTYPGREGGFMVCMPCDSATRHDCTGDECPWTYTDGLNPRNPRSPDNETRRPDWADAGKLHY